MSRACTATSAPHSDAEAFLGAMVRPPWVRLRDREGEKERKRGREEERKRGREEERKRGREEERKRGREDERKRGREEERKRGREEERKRGREEEKRENSNYKLSLHAFILPALPSRVILQHLSSSRAFSARRAVMSYIIVRNSC
jgi:hypothetical protein